MARSLLGVKRKWRQALHENGPKQKALHLVASKKYGGGDQFARRKMRSRHFIFQAGGTMESGPHDFDQDCYLGSWLVHSEQPFFVEP